MACPAVALRMYGLRVGQRAPCVRSASMCDTGLAGGPYRRRDYRQGSGMDGIVARTSNAALRTWRSSAARRGSSSSLSSLRLMAVVWVERSTSVRVSMCPAELATGPLRFVSQGQSSCTTAQTQWNPAKWQDQRKKSTRVGVKKCTQWSAQNKRARPRESVSRSHPQNAMASQRIHTAADRGVGTARARLPPAQHALIAGRKGQKAEHYNTVKPRERGAKGDHGVAGEVAEVAEP